MPFTTYAELKTAIATQLARSDLTDSIPDFITLFENVAARKLRVRPMETVDTITMTSGTGPLPAGFLGFKRVTWPGDVEVELTPKHPSMIKALYPTGATGIPADYTVEATNIIVRPSDDTALSVVYYAKNDVVSGALNWLYTNHPDVYLFGSMCEAKLFLEDYEEAALWKSRRDEVFEEIKLVNFREGSGLSMQVYGITP